MTETPAQRWARQLRSELVAEIQALETGKRKVSEATPTGEADVSGRTAELLRMRLKQVETLIASFNV
jgi:hypothetical protein